MPKPKHTAALSSGLILLATLRVGPAEAQAKGDDMRKRVEEIKQQFAAERALPEDQKWEKEEAGLWELEDKAEAGETHGDAFLTMGRERLAKARRANFQQKWGRLLNHPDATIELRAHAQRVAQLRRIRVLAVSRKFPAVAKRAQDLMKAEAERHQKSMQRIVDDLAGEGKSSDDTSDHGVQP